MRVIQKIRRAAVLGTVLTLFACGGSKSTDPDNAVSRHGRDFAPRGFNTHQNRPSLSADGTKFLLVSTASGQPLVYKSTSDIGSAVSKPSLLHATGVTDTSGKRLAELKATLSPDGKNALVVLASSKTTQDIYWYDFSGATAPQLVGKDYQQVDRAIFSMDSLIFTYTASKTSAGTVIRGVYAGLSSEPSKPVGISPEGTDEEAKFFLNQTAPYTLIIGRLGKDGATTLASLAISAGTEAVLSALPTGKRNTWTASPVVELGSKEGLLGFANAYFVTAPASPVNVSTLGTFEPHPVTPIAHEFIAFDITAPTTATRIKAVGSTIRDMSFSAVEDLGIYVSTVEYRCTDDNSFTTGTALVQLKAKESSLLLPHSSDSETWSLATDICDRSQPVIDNGIVSAEMNSGATSTKSRVIYTSNLAKGLDSYVLDTAASKTTITRL